MDAGDPAERRAGRGSGGRSASLQSQAGDLAQLASAFALDGWQTGVPGHAHPAQDTTTLPAFNLPSGKEPLLIEDCQPA